MENDEKQGEEYLSREEAAKYLNVGLTTFIRLEHAFPIPWVTNPTTGKRRYYKKEDLDRALRSYKPTQSIKNEQDIAQFANKWRERLTANPSLVQFRVDMMANRAAPVLWAIAGISEIKPSESDVELVQCLHEFGVAVGLFKAEEGFLKQRFSVLAAAKDSDFAQLRVINAQYDKLMGALKDLPNA